MISAMVGTHRGLGLFAYEEITAEIQAFINAQPRGTQQRLAEAVFPALAPRNAASEFRHRMTERQGMRFSFEELGVICAAASKIKSKDAPLRTWPFLPWKDAEAVDAVLSAIGGARH